MIILGEQAVCEQVNFSRTLLGLKDEIRRDGAFRVLGTTLAVDVVERAGI